MSLEKLLENPEKCLKIAGSKLRRKLNRIYHNIQYYKIMEVAARNSFTDAGTENIIESAVQDSTYAHYAGFWNPNRFNRYAEQIIADRKSVV